MRKLCFVAGIVIGFIWGEHVGEYGLFPSEKWFANNKEQ